MEIMRGFHEFLASLWRVGVLKLEWRERTEGGRVRSPLAVEDFGHVRLARPSEVKGGDIKGRTINAGSSVAILRPST